MKKQAGIERRERREKQGECDVSEARRNRERERNVSETREAHMEEKATLSEEVMTQATGECQAASRSYEGGQGLKHAK